MDSATVDKLRILNNAFYEQQAASFSATRQHAWPGWSRVLQIARRQGRDVRSVLDIACGNLRFERFCRQQGLQSVEYYGVDSCPALADGQADVVYRQVDILECLVRGGDLPSRIDVPPCDLVTCFGFMHHVPGADNRVALGRALVQMADERGLVALTFWQFARDGRSARKARASTDRACAQLGLNLGRNDYVLGWQDKQNAFRYCHHFDDDEIDCFAHALSCCAEVVDRYRSDGRGNDMNTYLIVRPCANSTQSYHV